MRDQQETAADRNTTQIDSSTDAAIDAIVTAKIDAQRLLADVQHFNRRRSCAANALRQGQYLITPTLRVVTTFQRRRG